MQRRENAQDDVIDIIILWMRVAMTTRRVFDIIFYTLAQLVAAMAMVMEELLMSNDRRVATTWREPGIAGDHNIVPGSRAKSKKMCHLDRTRRTITITINSQT